MLNIQIWVGLLHNIMIHKCFFQGLVALNREFNAKILNKKQMERLQERLSHIIPQLNFGVVCGLIDNALPIAITKIHITIINIHMFIISIAIVIIIIIIIIITIFITVIIINIIIVFVKSAWWIC